MQNNLISCDCISNPYQTLPYEQCSYVNRGCRQCPAGQYQDDLYSRCTACGSACPLGFRAFNITLDANNLPVKAKYRLSSLNLCGPSISTSQALTFADPVYDPFSYGMDQLKIGCVPCECGAYNNPQQVVFTLPGCHWICRRDPTNQSEPDYYCKVPLMNGTCNQQCIDCQHSLNSLIAPPTFGYYIQPCQDGIGHAYAPCDPPPDPNAVFTGNSPSIGDSKGCPWDCKKPGFQLLRGSCVSCFRTGTCAPGEVLQPCGLQFYCAPCTLVKDPHLLQPMQVWYSTDTFLDCVPGCEEGYAFSLLQNDDGGICHQCSQPDCALDEERVLCTRHNDTYCRPCPTLPFQNHQEFYSPGLCLTRCAQGYAQTDRTCQLCSQQVCGPGLQLSSDCYSPADRERLPSCIPCPPLALGAMFLQGCQTTCISGWMYVSDSNRTCVPCDISGCPLGYQGFCAGGELQCTLCQWPLDRSKTLAGPGNCTVVCAPNYAPRFDHPSPLVCVLLVETPQSVLPGPPPPGPAVAVVAWGVDLSNSNASMQSGFPTRTVPHT